MSNIDVVHRARERSRLALVPASVILGPLFILVIACPISLLISLTEGYGNLQSLSVLMVISFFMAAFLPFFIASYYENVFLILLMSAANRIYCISLTFLNVEIIVINCFPLFILLTIFVFRFRNDLRLNPFVVFILFLLIFPSLIGSIDSGLVGPDKIATYIFVSFCIPMGVFAAINSNLDADHVENIVCISFLFMMALSLILIPIEIVARGSGTVTSMEVGGRSYVVLAVLILIFPVLRDWWSRQSRSVFWFSLSLVMLGLVFSFSRGVFLFAIMSALPFILMKILSKRTFLVRFIVFGFVVILLLLFVIDSNLVNDTLWFWSVRLNIYDNITEQYFFEISKILDSSGRSIFSDNVVHWIGEYFIFGSGVGSSPELIDPSTGVRLGYGGMHNQLLTIFVERGVFGVMAIIVLWAFYSRQMSRLSHNQGKLIFFYCFLLYLMYAHTTGIELLIISKMNINSDALLYLLMMVGIVRLRLREAR